MLYNNVNIETLVCELPPTVLTSEEIEKRLEPLYNRLNLPSGRLELMTGIRERRLWPPGFLPSAAAHLAGKKALKMSTIPPEAIGCLIMCSVSRDFLEPATATVVHNSLQLPEKSIVFDISNACLGILTGMLTVANMIELGQIKAGMLVAGENSRPLLESTIKELIENKTFTRKSVKSFFSSLTIGSGSVAVILAHKDISRAGHRFLGGVSMAVTKHNALCRGNEDKAMSDNMNTLMNTDSEALMRHGVEVAFETWDSFKQELKWSNETPDCICTHQVGTAHKRLLFERLGLNSARDFETLSFLGNTGSVSCPATFAIAVEKGFVRKGNRIAMLGIGSGINCTMLGVEW